MTKVGEDASSFCVVAVTRNTLHAGIAKVVVLTYRAVMSCPDEIERSASITNVPEVASLEDIANGIMDAGVVLVQDLVDTMGGNVGVESDEHMKRPGTIDVSNAAKAGLEPVSNLLLRCV